MEIKIEDGIIYHMAEKSLWEGCGEEYYPPTYKADGFIHATKDPVMLIGIANHFYKASKGDWVLLHLSEAKLTHEVKYEVPMPVGDTEAYHHDEAKEDEPKFPHIYGPINKTSCVKETKINRDADGTFLSFGG